MTTATFTAKFQSLAGLIAVMLGAVLLVLSQPADRDSRGRGAQLDG